MTGLRVHVLRDGRWVGADLDTLTDLELDAWERRARESAPFDGYRFAATLARWIRDRVPSPAADAPAEIP